MTAVGAGDLQHALRVELDQILHDTKGNELSQSASLLKRLRSLDLISDSELAGLTKLAKISKDVGVAKKSAQSGYFESRSLYNALLATSNASPVALAIASSTVGSYRIAESAEGSGTVVFSRSGGNWSDRGAAAGAIIGSLWGPAGAAVGGTIGGLVGHAVDECKDKGK